MKVKQLIDDLGLQILLNPDIKEFTKAILDSGNKDLFGFVCKVFVKCPAKDVVKNCAMLDGIEWSIYEAEAFKYICNSNHDYHEFYDYSTGFTCRFGKNISDDPTWSPLGNTIADIEIVSGKCPKINGHNCRFCYKSNGGDVAKCMTSSDAEKLIDFINQNHQLQQIAFGITGFYTNPDFESILKMCKSKHITANYTTNGADIDDHAIDVTLENCGRVAVSCYEGAKDLCYSIMKRFGEKAKSINRRFPCNIHLLLSEDTMPHVRSVLKDAADNKIDNLGAIVMLRLKNVGRAKDLNPSISDATYEEVIKFCIDNSIKFGFDSCGCHRVEEVFKNIGRLDLISTIEPCESSRFSGYWNVESKYYNCSFCEQLAEHSPIDMFAYATFSDFWNSQQLKNLRNPPDGWKCKSCPFIKLD